MVKGVDTVIRLGDFQDYFLHVVSYFQQHYFNEGSKIEIKGCNYQFKMYNGVWLNVPVQMYYGVCSTQC